MITGWELGWAISVKYSGGGDVVGNDCVRLNAQWVVKYLGSSIVASKPMSSLLVASVHMIHSVQGIVGRVDTYAGISTSMSIQDVGALDYLTEFHCV